MKAVLKKYKKIHYYLSSFHSFLLMIHLIFIYLLYWKTLFSSSVFTLSSFSLPFFLKSISSSCVSILVLPEPVFVNLLRSPWIDSQPDGPVRQPYLLYRPAMLHRQVESNPRNRFLVSLNVYKYGLRPFHLRNTTLLHSSLEESMWGPFIFPLMVVSVPTAFHLVPFSTLPSLKPFGERGSLLWSPLSERAYIGEA